MGGFYCDIDYFVWKCCWGYVENFVDGDFVVGEMCFFEVEILNMCFYVIELFNVLVM